MLQSTGLTRIGLAKRGSKAITSDWLSKWNPWRGVGALPRGVWVLFASVLVNRMGTMVLPFLVLYMTKELGFPEGRAGAVLTLYGVGSLAASWLGGRLSDRFGPTGVMMTSLLLSTVVYFVFPMARGWSAVASVTVLLALTAESFRPASFAALADQVDAGQRKPAFAVLRLAANLGLSVGPAVGGLLAAVAFTWVFWVDGATTLAAALVLALWPLRTVHPRENDANRRSEQRAAPARAMADKRLLAFLAATVLTAAVFFQHVGAMPLYIVRHLGLPESVFGLVFTLNTLMIVFLEVRLNLSTTDWPYRRVLPLGALLVGAGFGALALCRDAWSVLATTVIWTVGEMVLLPAMSAYAADIAPEARRGEYMGLFATAWGAALAFGPWLGTELLERAGAGVLWSAVFACGAASALILFRLPEPGQRGG